MISRALACAAVFCLSAPALLLGGADDTAFLTWSGSKAQQIVRTVRVDGRVGPALNLRMLHTERSYNYKLRATWLTPDVVKATARLIQLAEHLTDAETQALVAETTHVDGTVVLIEIDPREGSGVIPLDWVATLRSQGAETRLARGVVRPELKVLRAYSGGFRRDYNYDVFLVEFPLQASDGKPLLDAASGQIELVVRIHDKEGRVTWPIPTSIR
jgi:hypothetical protein